MKASLRLTLLLLIFCVGGLAFAQEDVPLTLTVDGQPRSFYVHLPPGHDSETPSPLVIVLHGAGMNGLSMMLVAQFNDLADASGYIVAYPNGMNQRWNASNTVNPEEQLPDDVGFMAALIDDVDARYNVDREHVFATGYSSGGRMALRLGCSLSDQLAGVVAVGANLSFEIAEACMTAEPVSFFMVLGTVDQSFPWQGYAAVEDGVLSTAFSVAQTMNFLPTLLACQTPEELVTVSTEDSPIRVVRDAYVDCAGDTEVLLYALMEADHAWPLEPTVNLADGQVGLVKDAIWEFFTRHTGE